jgi:hypothetical protein
MFLKRTRRTDMDIRYLGAVRMGWRSSTDGVKKDQKAPFRTNKTRPFQFRWVFDMENPSKILKMGIETALKKFLLHSKPRSSDI